MSDIPHAIDRVLPDEAATVAFGARLAACVMPGMRLYLSGGLGAGKTTLVRATLAALGHRGRVRSPSFTVLESYNLPGLQVHHLDFYRLSDDTSWRDQGFDELFDGDGLVLVEWPERFGARLPAPDLRLVLAIAADGIAREVRIEAATDRGRTCLTTLVDSDDGDSG